MQRLRDYKTIGATQGFQSAGYGPLIVAVKIFENIYHLYIYILTIAKEIT